MLHSEKNAGCVGKLNWNFTIISVRFRALYSQHLFLTREYLVRLGISPSIQVNINTLRNAVRDGFAFAGKGNDEIATGFRILGMAGCDEHIRRGHEHRRGRSE